MRKTHPSGSSVLVRKIPITTDGGAEFIQAEPWPDAPRTFVASTVRVADQSLSVGVVHRFRRATDRYPALRYLVMPPDFDMADFSAERTAEKIKEIRAHIREELVPGAREHAESHFLVPFAEYLALRAERFEKSIEGPEDHLALATRNLLEFWSLINQVFTNVSTRAHFIGEMYVDSKEIRERVEKMGVPGHMLQQESPEWDAIPDRRVRVMKDEYDDYFFKLSSKFIHPSAVSILAPQSLPGPFVFYFFGCNYLSRSYNFLSQRIFSNLELGIVSPL